MATLKELSDLMTGTTSGAGELRAKIAVAALSRATAIVGEATPSSGRKTWAQNMLMSSPAGLIDELFRYTVLTNDSLTVAQILSVTDAQVQGAVNTAVDALYP